VSSLRAPLITCPGCRRPLGESQFYARRKRDGVEVRERSMHCIRCNDRLQAAIDKSHRDANERRKEGRR
jgi:hypothetical protein